MSNNLKKETSEEVCDLLLGFSRTDLQEVKDSYLSPKRFSNKVSEVLSSAFIKTVAEDDTIANSLSPVIRDGFRAEIRENPEDFAEVLAPIMGPAIRASILNALNERMESIDTILQQSFTPTGLKWRFQSLVTGRKFTDIALSNTLLYKIEDIFLIFKKDSTLLATASTDPARVDSSDLISAMLSGISDFATDSFGEDENSKFSTFRVGELSVRVFDGADAVLAVSHKGSLNSEARIGFEDFLDYFHVEYENQLESYNGDDSSFESVTELLEKMLGEKLKEVKSKESKFSPIGIIGLLLLVPFAMYSFYAWYQKQQLNDLLSDLKLSPGVTVTKASSGWRSIEIEGIRDPVSSDPRQEFQKHVFFGDPPFPFLAPKLKVDFASYASLDPRLLAERISRGVVFPKNSSYKLLENGEVLLSGKLSRAERDSLVVKLQALPGVNKVSFSNVLLLGELKELKQAIEKLEETKVFFDPLVVSVEKAGVQQVAKHVREILKLSLINKQDVQLLMAYHQGIEATEGSHSALVTNRFLSLKEELRKLGFRESQFSIIDASKLTCKNCDSTKSYIYFSANLRVSN